MTTLPAMPWSRRASRSAAAGIRKRPRAGADDVAGPSSVSEQLGAGCGCRGRGRRSGPATRPARGGRGSGPARRVGVGAAPGSAGASRQRRQVAPGGARAPRPARAHHASRRARANSSDEPADRRPVGPRAARPARGVTRASRRATVGRAAQERGDDPAGQLAARVRGVAAAARRARRGSTDPAARRVDEHEVGRLAGRERAAVAGEPADPRGRDGHPVGDAGPVEQAGVDHRLLHDRQRGLQAEHAHGGGGPLAVLVLVRVRGVVGGDDVDRAVGQRLAQRLDVAAGAQRRVDLVDRVVACATSSSVSSRWCGVTSAVTFQPLRLGPADDLDRAGGATRGRRAAGSRRARRAARRGR